MDTQEYKYRQIIAAKSLYYAIKGDEQRSEALRFFLRKLGEEDEKEISFPEDKSMTFKKAA